MPRRNHHIRFDKGAAGRAGTRMGQKGKGKKRRPDWHSSSGSNENVAATLPDLATGVDVTAAAPTRILRSA